MAGLIVVGVRALMAGVDEHSFHAVLDDGPLELFQEGLAAAGQAAGENYDPVLCFC